MCACWCPHQASAATTCNYFWDIVTSSILVDLQRGLIKTWINCLWTIPWWNFAFDVYKINCEPSVALYSNAFCCSTLRCSMQPWFASCCCCFWLCLWLLLLLLRPLCNRTRTWVWRSWVFAKKIKTWLYTLKQSVETNVFWWNNTVKRRTTTTTTQKSNENCSLLLPSPSLPSKRCLTSQA